ncbi:hypothetical protein [Fodinicola acaciae]|uniref:hypothetical protein n=1 Tax=Fodinicola acaciae TaxID=2681555 RepID=UPI0013D8B8C0|nr:hypothetical protein [Fodinicola acaciae]
MNEINHDDPEPHETEPFESATQTAPTTTARRNGDIGTTVGLLVVGAGSGLLSLATWANLSDLVGVTTTVRILGVSIRMAWLLPLIVDAFLIITTRDWQRPAHAISEGTRALARRCAIGAVIVSILANAIYQALTTPGGITRLQWWIAVFVAAMPPVMFALAAHLRARHRSDREHPTAVDTSSAGCGHDLTKVEKMRAHWLNETATGRTPSSAELARTAGASLSHARAERRGWLREFKDAQQTKTPGGSAPTDRADSDLSIDSAAGLPETGRPTAIVNGARPRP